MKKYLIFCIMFLLLVSTASAEDISITFDDNPIGTPLTIQAGGKLTIKYDVVPGLYVKEVRATSDAPAMENYIERYIGMVGDKEVKSSTKEITLPKTLPDGTFMMDVMIVYDNAQGVEKIQKHSMQITVEGGSGLLGWLAKNTGKDVFFAVKNVFEPVIIERENPEMTPGDLIGSGLEEIGLTTADINAGKYTMELVKDIPPVEMKTSATNSLQAVSNTKASGAYNRIEGDYEITITKSAKVYKITNTANGESVLRAKVLLSVTSPGGVYDVETMEVIPKSISDNTGNMGFVELPVILEADPIVKWNFDYVPEEQAKDYTYVTEKGMDNVDTTTISKGFEVGAFAKFVVFLIKGGWILMLLLIIAAIVGLVVWKKKGGKGGKKESKPKKEKKAKK